MVDIRFVINLQDGDTIEEADLPADDAGLRARLGDFTGAEGALIIDAGEDEEIVFADVLRLLIPAFCLDGLATLVREKRHTVSFFNHEETVTLSLEDDEVAFSGDHVEPQSVRAEPYLAAQRACGARYVALARRLWRDNPAARVALEGLEASLAADGDELEAAPV